MNGIGTANEGDDLTVFDSPSKKGKQAKKPTAKNGDKFALGRAKKFAVKRNVLPNQEDRIMKIKKRVLYNTVLYGVPSLELQS